MRKMFLVPVDQYERMHQRSQNPYTEKMIELEGELRAILNDSTKEAWEKSLLYGQILQKYLNYKSQETEAYKSQETPRVAPPPPSPPPPPPEESTVPQLVEEEKQYTLDDILGKTRSKKEKRRIEKVVAGLPSPIGWDSKGQLTVNKKPIEHSSIASLVYGELPKASKKRRTRAESDAGYNEFRAVVDFPHAGRWMSLPREENARSSF